MKSCLFSVCMYVWTHGYVSCGIKSPVAQIGPSLAIRHSFLLIGFCDPLTSPIFLFLFEHFLTFRHHKLLQAHLEFSVSLWNQPFLQGPPFPFVREWCRKQGLLLGGIIVTGVSLFLCLLSRWR